MFVRCVGVSLIAGAGLLGCSPSAPGNEAVLHLQDALRSVCEPWMHGKVREVLEEKLKPAGWALTDDAAFGQGGAWGRVKVSVAQGDAPLKRSCVVNFNSGIEPWSMTPAMDAVEQWLEAAYPGAVKATASPAVVEGRSVDVQAWVADDVKFARGVQREKQTAPVFDMFLMVRRD